MKVKVWALIPFAFVYLIVGVMWAFTFGVQTLTLKWGSGEEHRDFILSVTSAHIARDGNLVICVAGLREQSSEKSAAPPVPFSIILPIAELWNSPESAKNRGGFIPSDQYGDVLFIPRTWTKDGCTNDALAPQVPVIAIPATHPADFMYAPGQSRREQLIPPEGHEHAVFVVPRSSDGAEFNRSREIDYVAARPNAWGKRAYEIVVMPAPPRVPLWRWPVAIAIDVLTWPYEVLVWLALFNW